MTQPIDTAYVDIVSEPRSRKKFEKDIDRTMDNVTKGIEKDLKEIEKDFQDTFAEIDNYFTDMNAKVTQQFAALQKATDNVTNEIQADFKQTAISIGNEFDKIGDDANSSFRRARSRFFEPFEAGIKAIGGMVGELGKSMFQLVSGVGGAIGSNPLLALILALAPAVIALSAALSSLIGIVGLIPASLGVLIAIIAPLIIAFQNFGDAVSAVAEGDLEKMNEALNKLSPSARTVALEIGKLMPVLRNFQRTIQESFFSQIVGDLTRLATQVLPVLRQGLGGIASALGGVAHQLAVFLALPGTLQVLNELFASTARIVTTLSGPLIGFLSTIGNVVHESLPFVERLAAAFGRALESFSAFVDKSIETGEFDKFIEEAITTVKELIDLVKSLGGLLGTLFGATEEEGHNFIKTLTEVITKMDEFLKSADGQTVLDALVFAVKALGLALKVMVDSVVLAVNVFNDFLGIFETIGRGFVGFITTIGEWLGKIPTWVTEFISTLPEKVTGFFRDMFDRVLLAIGIGVGMVLFAIQVLPEKIGKFFLDLPEKVYTNFLGLVQVVSDVVTMAVDAGKNLLVNGFNGIVDFITSVPGRIRDLIPNFSAAGTSLIESFMNGFRKVGSFIGDIAGDIVGAVKGFLNKAIDKINVGIAKVDAVLPGDMGRIPRLADGALVKRRPGGILANIGEGDEDEVVAPLSKLEGMFQGGQSVVFGPGAINVSFEGVVPTEDQARATGAALGQGIISKITQRSARLQVRAV